MQITVLSCGTAVSECSGVGRREGTTASMAAKKELLNLTGLGGIKHSFKKKKKKKNTHNNKTVLLTISLIYNQ